MVDEYFSHAVTQTYSENENPSLPSNRTFSPSLLGEFPSMLCH